MEDFSFPFIPSLSPFTSSLFPFTSSLGPPMKYIRIAFYATKEIFFYKYILIVQIVRLLFLTFVLTALFTYGAQTKWLIEIGWISITLYIWYVFFTELIMTNRRDADLIAEIKSGSIVTYLTKPIHFILYYFSLTFGKTAIKMLCTGSVAAITIAICTYSFPWFWIWRFFLFLCSLCLGIGLLSLFSLLMGLAAFALEDSRFIRFFLNKLYFIFGGLFFPLDIYPERLQNVSKFLPFQYYMYAPAKFFATGDLSFFWQYFPIQIGWFIGIGGTILLLYGQMVKRVEINGG